MTDTLQSSLFGNLAMAHLWQSVALAAVLAVALILGRRLAGATRYHLAAGAFIAALLLPMAAFIPGESVLRMALDAVDAPVSVKTEAQVAAERAERAKVEAAEAAATEPFWAKTAREGGTPEWAIGLGQRVISAATQPYDSSRQPSALEKAAIKEGAPPTIARAIVDAIAPLPVAPVKPQPKPWFTMPNLPNIDLSAFVLPILLVWIAGAVLMLVRTGRDLIAVERLVARATPVELPAGLKERMRGVRVAASSEAPGPMAAGLFRPVVVLPESHIAQLTSKGMAALLEHERAHIERRDMMVALLQRIVLALLWWSPALHWISRRIDEERELACDETAVERTGDARAFARSLTTQAENQLWARAPRLAVGAIGPRSGFGFRIKRLIDIAKSGASRSKYAGRVAFSVFAIAIVSAALVTPRIIAQPKSPPPVDSALAGAPQTERSRVVDNTAAVREALAEADADLDELDALGPEFAGLMDEIAQEVRVALNDVSPELEGELGGLASELAALGGEIALSVNEELAAELPGIMEEVRAALQEIDESEWDQEFNKEEFRAAMDELREELRQEFGPEFREKLRAELTEARREIEAHKHEWRAEREQGLAVAREALAEARREVARARERGDFNFDFDFDLDGAQFQGKWDGDANSWKEFGQQMKQFGDQQRAMGEAARERAEAARERAQRVRGEALTPSRRLMIAASRGDDERVRELISQGADVNAVFRGDGTALIAAAREGEVEVVRLLLDAGADPNKASRGDGNPLIAAAAEGENEIVRMLLARGADPNAYVEDDETPLINAAREGEMEIVRMLVDKGADVNRAYRADGVVRSPLGMAERHGADDVARYLRSKGAKSDPKPVN